MEILDQITDYCNDGWGEDRMFVTGTLCGVVDGATPVKRMNCGGYHSSAEWMVDTFQRYAMKAGDKDFRYICRDFVNETGNREYIAGLSSVDKPCFTAAAVREAGDRIEGALLGDSSIYVELKCADKRSAEGTDKGNTECPDHVKIVSYCDDRAAHFSARTVAVMQDAKERGLDEKEIAEVVSIQKAKNRKMMNHEGGYWVVAYEGDFVDEFTCFSYSISDVERILLCSDGFARLFDMENQQTVSVEDILSSKISLHDAVKILRHAEEQEAFHQYVGQSDGKAGGQNRGQVKVHDDVTAILLKFNN